MSLTLLFLVPKTMIDSVRSKSFVTSEEVRIRLDEALETEEGNMFKEQYVLKQEANVILKA